MDERPCDGSAVSRGRGWARPVVFPGWVRGSPTILDRFLVIVPRRGSEIRRLRRVPDGSVEASPERGRLIKRVGGSASLRKGCACFRCRQDQAMGQDLRAVAIARSVSGCMWSAAEVGMRGLASGGGGERGTWLGREGEDGWLVQHGIGAGSVHSGAVLCAVRVRAAIKR